jgi:hypothetical protein
MNGFEDTLISLSDNSSKMVDYSYGMENSVFIVLAKLEHILYKSRVYNSIISLNKMLEQQSTHQCELGIWHDAEGKRRFSQTTSFSKIAAPHETVHQNANANLAYLDRDGEFSTLKGATIIMENFERMEKASEELFELLDKMLQESR